MEYYDLRKAGDDIDLIASQEDLFNLIKLFPNRVKDLWGDIGVCPFEFEIWKSIHSLTYDDLKDGAINEGDILIPKLEKLVFIPLLTMDKEKYLNDTKVIARKLNRQLYEQRREETKKSNTAILHNIPNIVYIEKTGPVD